MVLAEKIAELVVASGEADLRVGRIHVDVDVRLPGTLCHAEAMNAAGVQQNPRIGERRVGGVSAGTGPLVALGVEERPAVAEAGTTERFAYERNSRFVVCAARAMDGVEGLPGMPGVLVEERFDPGGA